MAATTPPALLAKKAYTASSSLEARMVKLVLCLLRANQTKACDVIAAARSYSHTWKDRQKGQVSRGLVI